MQAALLVHRPRPVEMEHPMKARVRTAVLAGMVLGGATAGAAEPVTEHGASAAVLLTASDDGEALTGRASLWGQGGYVLENQWELGGGLGVAVERDDPARDPRGGRFGNCPPALAGCASIAGAPVRGLMSGISAAGPEADESVRASLESAYLYLKNPWGEASLGRDAGVGQRFSLTPPSILAISGGLDPAVEGTGLGAVILRNDISGQSAKAVVTTARLFGVQAGVSWTPELEHEGLDQGYRQRFGAPAVAEPEDIVEAGLSFAHTFAGGWETAAGLTYATAEEGTARPEFGGVESWSAGASLTRGAWSFGASWLTSDNGWAAGGRDYEAWGASGVFRSGSWAFMLEGGASKDDLPSVEQKTLTLAAKRTLSERVALAGGANWRDVLSPSGVGSSQLRGNRDVLGAFLEISWDL
jgi:predicted porin